jgi:formimidoylglutamate deiminase
MSRAFFAPSALLPDGWASDVRLEVDDRGVLNTIERDAVPGDAVRLPGPVVPGMPNLHSHAFQRALVGRTQVAGPGEDSFWTWRQAMYASLDRLGPDEVAAVAGWLAVELLEGGFTGVAEFHYVHHQPDGTPYTDRAELGRRTLHALRSAGLSVAMLPVLYAHSGFGGQAPTPGQRRFVNDVDGVLDIVAALRAQAAGDPGVCVGLAPHSLRAVTPDELSAAVSGLGPDAPVHIHISEQEKEVADCIAWSGARPVRWLLDHAAVDARWCLVHATHLDAGETRDLVRSGAVAGLCPTTEADLGDGLFPGVDYARAGGAFGVGTDSHVGRSAAAELRLLEYGQRLRDRRRARMLPPGETHVGAALWRACAAGGAQALGMPTGRIAVGLAADLVALDADHPTLLGLTGDALLDAVVMGQGDGAVHTVVARGDVVVEAGRHRDREARLRAFRAAMARLG